MTWLARICFGLSAVFAVWTIVLVVLMGGNSPEPAAPITRGFETPILALEFAEEEADLAFIAGDAGAPLRAELRRVQTLDVWFPIAYAGLAAWCFAGLGLTGRRIAWPGALLAAATIPADWAENAVINEILLRLGEGASVTALLPDLALTTWIKWALIAAYALVFALVMMLEKRFLLSLPALAGGTMILLTGITGGRALFAEMITLPLALFFLTILMAAMLYLRASFKAETFPHESPRQVES
ncbi:hypothetical protein [Hyphobacterium sp.]|jgi:hypothetical protein|uniref:hypothetical protein n=1 Tax=Hyphobacterium sp. TaxID=2004662 RepID=UPI003BAD0D6B